VCQGSNTTPHTQPQRTPYEMAAFAADCSTSLARASSALWACSCAANTAVTAAAVATGEGGTETTGGGSTDTKCSSDSGDVRAAASAVSTRCADASEPSRPMSMRIVAAVQMSLRWAGVARRSCRRWSDAATAGKGLRWRSTIDNVYSAGYSRSDM